MVDVPVVRSRCGITPPAHDAKAPAAVCKAEICIQRVPGCRAAWGRLTSPLCRPLARMPILTDRSLHCFAIFGSRRRLYPRSPQLQDGSQLRIEGRPVLQQNMNITREPTACAGLRTGGRSRSRRQRGCDESDLRSLSSPTRHHGKPEVMPRLCGRPHASMPELPAGRARKREPPLLPLRTTSSRLSGDRGGSPGRSPTRGSPSYSGRSARVEASRLRLRSRTTGSPAQPPLAAASRCTSRTPRTWRWRRSSRHSERKISDVWRP